MIYQQFKTNKCAQVIIFLIFQMNAALIQSTYPHQLMLSTQKLGITLFISSTIQDTAPLLFGYAEWTHAEHRGFQDASARNSDDNLRHCKKQKKG